MFRSIGSLKALNLGIMLHNRPYAFCMFLIMIAQNCLNFKNLCSIFIEKLSPFLYSIIRFILRNKLFYSKFFYNKGF